MRVGRLLILCLEGAQLILIQSQMILMNFLNGSRNKATSVCQLRAEGRPFRLRWSSERLLWE